MLSRDFLGLRKERVFKSVHILKSSRKLVEMQPQALPLRHSQRGDTGSSLTRGSPSSSTDSLLGWC